MHGIAWIAPFTIRSLFCKSIDRVEWGIVAVSDAYCLIDQELTPSTLKYSTAGRLGHINCVSPQTSLVPPSSQKRPRTPIVRTHIRIPPFTRISIIPPLITRKPLLQGWRRKRKPHQQQRPHTRLNPLTCPIPQNPSTHTERPLRTIRAS